MLEKIKAFFIGNLDSKAVKDEISQSASAVIKKNFGKIGGDVYFIKPKEGLDLKLLLNQFDEFPNGRSADNIVNFFVGGPFILTRTDENAIKHHQLYTHSLSRPKDYLQFTLDALTPRLEHDRDFDLKTLIVQSVRQAIAKGLFNIDQLTPEFASALAGFSKITNEDNNGFAETVLFHLVGAYYFSLLKLRPLYKTVRDEYVKSAQAFVNSQADKILVDLRSYAEGEKINNILSLSVIELIKEQRPEMRSDRNRLNSHLMFMNHTLLKPYLEDAYIRTLPASIFPGDNIITILTCAITALAQDPALVEQLRLELQAQNILEDADHIHSKIDQNKHENGLLHRLYLESLRLESLEKSIDDLEFGSLIWRFTDETIEVDGKSIPPNSMVAIINSMPRYDKSRFEKPEQFNPARFFNQNAAIPLSIFSYGHRKCPAQTISEYIFKAFISHIVANHDFSLDLTDKHHPKIHLLPVVKNENEDISRKRFVGSY